MERATAAACAAASLRLEQQAGQSTTSQSVLRPCRHTSGCVRRARRQGCRTARHCGRPQASIRRRYARGGTRTIDREGRPRHRDQRCGDVAVGVELVHPGGPPRFEKKVVAIGSPQRLRVLSRFYYGANFRHFRCRFQRSIDAIWLIAVFRRVSNEESASAESAEYVREHI